MKYLKCVLIIVLMSFCVLRSEIPNTMSYQGILKDSSGNTLNGNYNLLFKLYTTESGGTAIWQDNHTSVEVEEGVFSVILDDLSTLDFENEYWLGITVNSSTELSPRANLTSVPYSFIAGAVPDASITTDKISSAGATFGQAIMYNGTNIVWDTPSGGGIEFPYSKTVNSTNYILDLEQTGTGEILQLDKSNASAGGDVIDIQNDGSGYSIDIDHNGAEDCLNIDNDGSSSDAIHIYNRSVTDDGIDINSYGDNVIEITNNGSGSSLDIDNNSDADDAIYIDNDGDGHGIKLENDSDQPYTGMYLKQTGNGYGAFIYISNSSSSAPALYTQTTGSGYAAYFYGDIRISGSTYSSLNSTVIDHPLDPANKYLQHTSIEAPEMLNVYNGNIILDSNGEAYVELPDYFEALNKDFRYQLTTIGGYSTVYIAKEVSNNTFKISGGESGMKVSWQITGVRKDPYSEANRIQVEVDKVGEERGKYLHYKEYNQPIENSILAILNSKVDNERKDKEENK